MASPNYLLKLSKSLAVSSFKRAAKKVPFYKKFLQQSQINPDKIKTIKDFMTSVPPLNKEKLFTANLSNIKDICVDASLKNCGLILPSSGYSGIFSFGLNSKNLLKKQAISLNRALNYVFNTSHKKTLLINTLSMGVTIPASSVTLANTGPRSDTVISLVKTFAKEFNQIIISGDNSFLKNTIEQGAEQGISWKNLNIRLILGGETFPESFRTYLASLLGINFEIKDNLCIGSSMGFSEIGLNILQETKESILLRRKASINESLRAGLLGKDSPLCPMLLQFHPLHVFVEEANGELLFTDLNPKLMLPIIRYSTGDMGSIIPFEKLKELLLQHNLKECMPAYKLPLIVLKGRSQHLDFNGKHICPNLTKHILYSIPGLPRLITGYFRIKKTNDKFVLEIQLKANQQISEEIKNKLKENITKYINVESDLIFYPYYELPFGIELDYERKFKYI